MNLKVINFLPAEIFHYRELNFPRLYYCFFFLMRKRCRFLQVVGGNTVTRNLIAVIDRVRKIEMRGYKLF